MLQTSERLSKPTASLPVEAHAGQRATHTRELCDPSKGMRAADAQEANEMNAGQRCAKREWLEPTGRPTLLDQLTSMSVREQNSGHMRAAAAGPARTSCTETWSIPARPNSPNFVDDPTVPPLI